MSMTSPSDSANLLMQVGNTPLVPIRKLCPNPKVTLYAKVEKGNPGGSIKDRPALWMIETAEKLGQLRPGMTIIEATSGNTGIGLAMVAAIKGYPLLLAMSEAVSVERRKILAAYGAQFLLTPGALGTDGAIERAYEIASEQPDKFYLTDQFNNEANILAHYETTAPEIWSQTAGSITHLVASMGTTGTVVGCSRRLRELNPRVRIVGVEPYLGHKIQGLKNLKEAYVPGIYDASALDEKRNIDDDAAYEMTRRLAREEGLLVGMSSGAAMAIAVQLASEIEEGVVVAILPDGGERYLSTPLFEITQPEAVTSELRFFNTLSRRYEAFEPLSGDKRVAMYSCGPTVHRRPHLGILRRMLANDLIRRTLALAGYDVKHVVSITDVDDNTVQEAQNLGESMSDLCKRIETAFLDDLTGLGILPPTSFVRASESVEAMLKLTGDLMTAGVAYEKLRSVYFNIGRVKSYGELSGTDLGKIRVGATVDLDRYDKDDPRDFTLFRRSTLAELRKGVSYKSPWGNVRPSWHIQCSAMARASLGDRFDIHTASVDLIFPHNENEIAQSRALTGQSQANVWLHSELVLVDNKKMTYEDGVTLPDLLAKGFTAREIRYFLLRSHYRQPVHLTDERLEDARASLRRIDEFVENVRAVQGDRRHIEEVSTWIVTLKDAVRAALLEDVNVPAALAALFRFIRQVNYVMGRGELCVRCAKDVLLALEEVDRGLGILACGADVLVVPPEIASIIEERQGARSQGDFERADALRVQLLELGYVVEDRTDGARIRRVGSFSA